MAHCYTSSRPINQLSNSHGVVSVIVQTSFSLVDPATATDPVVLQVFHEIEQELGFGMVPNIFRSMAGQPRLLAANWQKFKATILEGILPRTIKEMIGVVVSDLNGSPYAKQVHLHSLSVQGVYDLWLQQLTNEDLGDSALPESLHAMVAFTRHTVRDRQACGPDAYASLIEAGLSDGEIFEVVATIDLFQSINTYTNLAHVAIDQL